LFWSCFAPATATCYASIDCDKKKSAVLDNGASVEITSGISGSTHAWLTGVQWHTKTYFGVSHLLQTEAGFEDSEQLYMPNAPDQILSLSQLVEAGYMPHFQHQIFYFPFSSRWCARHVYDQVILTMEGGPGDQGYTTRHIAFIETPS